MVIAMLAGLFVFVTVVVILLVKIDPELEKDEITTALNQPGIKRRPRILVRTEEQEAELEREMEAKRGWPTE